MHHRLAGSVSEDERLQEQLAASEAALALLSQAQLDKQLELETAEVELEQTRGQLHEASREWQELKQSTCEVQQQLTDWQREEQEGRARLEQLLERKERVEAEVDEQASRLEDCVLQLEVSLNEADAAVNNTLETSGILSMSLCATSAQLVHLQAAHAAVLSTLESTAAQQVALEQVLALPVLAI